MRNKDKQLTNTDSPCVSNCCLDDNDICLGCGRHIDEITGWHSAAPQRKLEIKRKAAQRQAKRKNLNDLS